MVDREKGKGDAVDWKAPKDVTGSDLFEIDEPEQFLNLADLKPSLSDEDPTPPMGQPIKPKSSPVKEISLEDVQDRLRKEAQKTTSRKLENAKIESERKELDEIFEAVDVGDEGFIKGLLTREFGNVEFDSLDDLKDRLDRFFSGGREMSLNLNLKDLQNSSYKKKKMALVFRPRVGGKAPFVEIVLTNESGMGVRKDKTITRVTEARDVSPESNTTSTPKPKGFLERWFGKK